MHGCKWLTIAAALWLAGCAGGGADSDNRGALLDAAAEGNASATARQIDQVPESIDQPDSNGRTALHLALLNGHADVVAMLLSKGANPNVRDRAGQSPLHYAAIAGDARSAKMLLNAHADPTATDDTGKTPVELARMTGHQELADILANPH